MFFLWAGNKFHIHIEHRVSGLLKLTRLHNASITFIPPNVFSYFICVHDGASSNPTTLLLIQNYGQVLKNIDHSVVDVWYFFLIVHITWKCFFYAKINWGTVTNLWFVEVPFPFIKSNKKASTPVLKIYRNS